MDPLSLYVGSYNSHANATTTALSNNLHSSHELENKANITVEWVYPLWKEISQWHLIQNLSNIRAKIFPATLKNEWQQILLRPYLHYYSPFPSFRSQLSQTGSIVWACEKHVSGPNFHSFISSQHLTMTISQAHVDDDGKDYSKQVNFLGQLFREQLCRCSKQDIKKRSITHNAQYVARQIIYSSRPRKNVVHMLLNLVIQLSQVSISPIRNNGQQCS